MRLVCADAAALAPWVEGLRALEAGLSYPIDQDRFRIDHGRDYHAFFSQLGEPRFVIATEEARVVGTVALVARSARDDRARASLYFADLKVAPDRRGTGLARRLLLRAAWAALRERRFRSSDLVFFAAMRGARGDVTRAGRGLSPLRLFAPLAELALWFAPPARLAALPEGGPPPPGTRGLDLSPGTTGVVSTAGRKDLVLESTGRPWPLVHAASPPEEWRPTLGAWLGAVGRALLADDPSSLACFAIDRRLAAHVAWLEAQGLAPGATCTVHALFPFFKRRLTPPWVHLATSEI